MGARGREGPGWKRKGKRGTRSGMEEREYRREAQRARRMNGNMQLQGVGGEPFKSPR